MSSIYATSTSMITLAEFLKQLQSLVAADPKNGELPVVLVQDDWGDTIVEAAHEAATLGFYNASKGRVRLEENEQATKPCVVIWPIV